MVNKMQTIRLYGKKFKLPAPFRKSDWEETIKVKIPSKSKLAQVKVTSDQFVNDLEEYFNETYSNGAFDVTTRAQTFIRRGYIFLKISYNGHF